MGMCISRTRTAVADQGKLEALARPCLFRYQVRGLKYNTTEHTTANRAAESSSLTQRTYSAIEAKQADGVYVGLPNTKHRMLVSPPQPWRQQRQRQMTE